jgi:hypothetical protein
MVFGNQWIHLEIKIIWKNFGKIIPPGKFGNEDFNNWQYGLCGSSFNGIFI